MKILTLYLITAVVFFVVDAIGLRLMIKPVFEHLDTLKKAHPALRFLEVPGMARNGLAAPLHGGAKRYFQESGTM